MARVLVVEDDEDIRTIIERRVAAAGHTVRAVSSAQEALELVKERGAPEVAVLDVVLPGMSGLELAERLRQDDTTRELPIVFLSAKVQNEDIEAGRSLGAIYLTKPFVAAALLSAIERSVPKDSAW